MAGKVERRLAAILCADVVGYSRMTAADEEGTLARLRALREDLIDPKIAEHRGRIVKLMGDGILVEFASVVDAGRCAAELQNEMRSRNADVPEDQRVVYRVGINLGDIIIDGDDIHGDGVNIAARLEQLADPGGVMISAAAFDQAKNKVEVGFEDLGPQRLKNMPEPVRAYRVLLEAEAAGKVVGRKVKSAGLLPKRWRWAISVAAAVVLIGVAAGALLSLEPWVERVEAAAEENMAFALPDGPSIVVLPFENVGGDPKQDWFADGVTGDIVSHLAQLPELFVIDRNTTFAYKGKPITVKQVAEELGVRYVLGGSVQRSGELLRITTHLTDALSGKSLWSERYDRTAQDLFALQDEITRNVSVAIHVKLTIGEVAKLWPARSGENLEAWELYSRATYYFLRVNKDDNVKSRELVERAIDVGGEQPAFVAALAWTHLAETWFGWSDDPSAAYARAVELANRARELDDTSPETFLLLGDIALVDGRYEEAIALDEKAIALAPSWADAYANLAQKLNAAGRPAESIPVMQKAMRFSPIHPDWYNYELASAFHLSGRLEDALLAYQETIARNPNLFGGTPYAALAVVAWELGRREVARKAIKDLLNQRPDYTVSEYEKYTSYNKKCCKQFLELLHQLGLPETPPLPLPG